MRVKSLSLIAALVFAAGVARADLVSYFSMDGNLLDSTSGNDGTYNGGAETYVPGFDGTAGGAVSFDGASYVELAATVGLPLTDNAAFSVAMWVKGPAQPDRRVFSEGSDTSNTPLYNIGTDNTGETGALDIFIRRDPNNGTAIGHLKRGNAFDDDWHHIAVVDDNGAMTLYIDGVQHGGVVNYTREPLTTNITTIGGILRAAPCCLYTGAIDEVYLYDHALSAEEVLALAVAPDTCAAEGDTTCDEVTVTPPEGGGAGQYTIGAAATDGDGDTVLYTYIVTGPGGEEIAYVGPTTDASIQVSLADEGTYDVAVITDDILICRDAAGVCNTTIDVVLDPPRMVSHWTFDRTLEDATEADNDGTYLGAGSAPYAPGWNCADGQSVRFNGSDGMVRAATNDSLPIYNNPNYSVAMWVKGPTNQRDMRVFSESNTQGNNNPLLNIGTDSAPTPTGVVDIFIRNDSGAQSVAHVKSTGVAFDDTWHHIAWVDENGNARLYIDGVQDATDFTYTRGALTIDSTTIGGILRGGPSHWFTGRIDDVRVYNYGLSTEEVEALAATPPDCPEVSQIAGDCNGDGDVNVADALCYVKVLFPGFLILSSSQAAPCDGDAGSAGNVAVLDVDGNGGVGIPDVIALVRYLFDGGAPPAQGTGCFPVLESAGCQSSASCM